MLTTEIERFFCLEPENILGRAARVFRYKAADKK